MRSMIRQFRPVVGGVAAMVAVLVVMLGPPASSAAAVNAAQTDQTIAVDDYAEADAGVYLTLDALANDTLVGSFSSFEVLSGEVPGMQVGPPFLGVGVLGGEPLEAGTFELTYRVTSVDGSSDTATITVVVNPTDPVIIEDTLLDIYGDPVPGIELVLFRRTGIFRGQLEYARTTTDENGSFRFDAIQGSYSIVFPALEDAVYVVDRTIGVGGSVAFWPGPRSYVHSLEAEPGDTFGGFGIRVGRTTAAVSGTVTGSTPDTTVVADLFSVTPTGERDQWQGTATLGAAGAYRLAMVPGDWIVTFSIRGGGVFDNGSSFRNVALSLADGEERTGVDVTLASSLDTTFVGSVTDDGGAPLEGVVVDLFAADADGTKLDWLGDVATDGDGQFTTTVTPGCHILVFISPDERTFAATGTAWVEQFVCIEAGQSVGVDALLVNPDTPSASAIGGTILNADGSTAAGVVVDLFVVDGYGTRTDWLGDSTTDPYGRYRFDTDPGCFAVVMIAPSGRTFTNGSPYNESTRCLDPGAVEDEVDATLAD